MDTFQSLNLSERMLETIRRRGYTEPTPIQQATIPLIMQGADVVAQARTGTGKTAAFGIPLVETVQGRGITSLVLAPTRELANQITEELRQLASGSPFKALAIFGGVGFGNQTAALARGNITCLVACPGRLLDLISRKLVNLRHVRTVVLDEADRMLDMGFIRDIEKIMNMLPRERQTLLFSATIPNDVRRVADRYLRNPEWVRTETDALTTPLAEQFHIPVSANDKLAPLLTLLEKEKPKRAVIFTRTKHGAKRLGKKLSHARYSVDALHGNLSQSARERVMAGFRAGAVEILVATDVAARGLDITELTHVIQYDVPNVPEDYVHRTGRTGRAGKEGRAFILVSPPEADDFRRIERIAGVPIDEFDLGPLVAVPQAVANAGPPARHYEQPGWTRGGASGRGYGRGRQGGHHGQGNGGNGQRHGGGRGRSQRPRRW